MRGDLHIRIIGGNAQCDIRRLRKRLACAGRALGWRVSVDHAPDDTTAAEAGACRGPLVLLGDRTLADGLESTEVLEQRLRRMLSPGSNRAGGSGDLNSEAWDSAP